MATSNHSCPKSYSNQMSAKMEIAQCWNPLKPNQTYSKYGTRAWRTLAPRKARNKCWRVWRASVTTFNSVNFLSKADSRISIEPSSLSANCVNEIWVPDKLSKMGGSIMDNWVLKSEAWRASPVTAPWSPRWPMYRRLFTVSKQKVSETLKGWK